MALKQIKRTIQKLITKKQLKMQFDEELVDLIELEDMLNHA